MAGKIKQLIDKIISERSHGNETIASTTRTKLILKGIRVSAFTESSEDNPDTITRIHEIAREMGVQL